MQWASRAAIVLIVKAPNDKFLAQRSKLRVQKDHATMNEERPRLSGETLNRLKRLGLDRYHISEEQLRALESLDNPEKSHWLAKGISYFGGFLELIALFQVYSGHWDRAVITGIVGLGLVYIGYRIQIRITNKQFNQWLRFKKEYITDEKKFSAFVMDFVQRDPLLSAILNPSNILLFSEGYRPHIGIPNDPEIGEAKFSDVLPYFIRKIYMDTGSLLPLNRYSFRAFIDSIVEHTDTALKSVMVIILKYNLEIQGKFNFESELAKIPAGTERETFKQNWLTDAILSAEVRLLAWIFRELFRTPYAFPEYR